MTSALYRLNAIVIEVKEGAICHLVAVSNLLLIQFINSIAIYKQVMDFASNPLQSMKLYQMLSLLLNILCG